MLTSKHHNLNKLVWRYGLTSAAAVLLAFGGGASSVKAEAPAAPLTSEQRQKEIDKIKQEIQTKYPKASEEKFWESSFWGRKYFNEQEYLKSLQTFTEQRLQDIVNLIEKGATKGDKGDAGPKGERGPAGQPGEKAPEKSKEVTPAPEKPADKEANQTPERRNGNMAKTPVTNNHRRLPATGEQANPFFTAAAVAVMTTAGVLAVTKRKENN
ncbi:TPA: LPXTG cell wall anchor domain-containing protein [Streptococcus pyogenes]|nr:LPXTG cell wall anchor domain-containing protein [Streptococcus pyogenes]